MTKKKKKKIETEKKVEGSSSGKTPRRVEGKKIGDSGLMQMAAARWLLRLAG